MRVGKWCAGHIRAVGKAISRAYLNRHSSPLRRYHRWWHDNGGFSESQRALIAQHITSGALPALHVLWILDGDDRAAVAAAVHGLKQQYFTDWTATLVVSSGRHASVDPKDGRIVLANAFMRTDSDLQPTVVIHGSISLDAFALYHFAAAHERGAKLVYCDEDSIGAWGRRHSPVFKNDFSVFDVPQYLPLGACFSSEARADQFYEIVETCAKGGQALANAKARLLDGLDVEDVAHIPHVLFSHKNGNAPDFRPQEPISAAQKYALPSVSIIIPTRDRLDLLRPCIESIRQLSDYPAEQMQIIVVDNQSSEPEAIAYLAEIARLGHAEILHHDDRFNYALINNRAAKTARGDILLFLNNDTIIDNPQWLRLLVAEVQKPGVGIVGGKLLYPDRTVQHAGVVLGVQGLALHAFRFLKEGDGGYLGLANRTRAVSAVTGACAAIRRPLFEEIGGFDEDLEVAFNDVSLCLAAMRRGMVNLCLGSTLLIHLESKSRGFDDTRAKQAKARMEGSIVRARHNALFRADPFYNPNLCVRRLYHLSMVPRRPRPWIDFRRRTTGKCHVLLLLGASGSLPEHVLKLAHTLQAAGHRVTIGGTDSRIGDDNIDRLPFKGVRQAARFAFFEGVDCIVALSPPYYSLGRHLAPGQLFVISGQALEEGRSSLSWREEGERVLCGAMADHVLADMEDPIALLHAVERHAGS